MRSERHSEQRRLTEHICVDRRLSAIAVRLRLGAIGEAAAKRLDLCFQHLHARHRVPARVELIRVDVLGRPGENGHVNSLVTDGRAVLRSAVRDSFREPRHRPMAYSLHDAAAASASDTTGAADGSACTSRSLRASQSVSAHTT